MRYFLLGLSLLFPAPSFAATLQFVQQPSEVRVSDTFTAELLLHTDTDIINAIEGSVQIPDALSLVDIHLSGSLVPLWITPPAENGKGIISFAGVLPGGYHGVGNLFTLVLRAAQESTATISFSNDTRVYLNDGKGTTAILALPTLTFLIQSSVGTPRSVSLEKDITPPESFTPIIHSGESFGLTGSVLVFVAQDKNSGIARYDIARSYEGTVKESDFSWHTIESPYALVAGDSIRYLYIRAVDREGNTRVAIVPPQSFSPIAFMLAWRIFLLTGVMIAVILSFWWYKRSRDVRAV